MSIFEKATRNKIRFNYKGVQSVEDLWDLDVKELDSIYKKLNSELKGANEESLLSVKSTANLELELKVQIVKHIVGVKLEEANLKVELKDKKDKKEKYLKILADKEEQELMKMTPEEIRKAIEDLS